MRWEVQYPDPKKPKPRPFDNYALLSCLGFAYAYTVAISTLNLPMIVIVELVWGYFTHKRSGH